MAFRRHKSPDMNLNDVEFGITYEICQMFDIDRGWEQLAGIIGYSTSCMKQFELETRRPDGSPTKKILWDWGTRGGTVRDLYNKLALMNRAQAMRLLDPIMNIGIEKDKEKGVKDEQEKEKKVPESNDTSMMSSGSMSLPSLKVGNLISRPSTDSLSYNPTSLPVPKKQGSKISSKQDDVNINKTGGSSLKSSDEKDLKLQSIRLSGKEPGAASVQVNECHADGPGSQAGNEGAASSARPFERNKSFERVKTAIDEYASQSSNMYMSQLSNEEKQVAIAMMATPNYTYKELSQATNGFRADHKLGQGKFGAVYQGVVKNTKCAIKKLFQKQERNDQDTASSHLSAELRALSRYRHENIVTLYGYALDGDEVCLVYQLMPNGSLDDCLHQRNGHNVLLDWNQRLNILKNAACGLQFLHCIDKKPVIHGDIKSANILLDRHFDAKIGDLGLAQQATGGSATGELTHITKKTTDLRDYKNQAYYAPEILRGNVFSVKGDAYAFGVVIFECLTGLEAYDEKREGSAEKQLVDYIENQIDEDPKMNREVFQDQQVKGPCPTSMFLALFGLAETCTAKLKKNRPTMVDVFQELERIGKDASLQETHSEGKSGVCGQTEPFLKREISEGYMSFASGAFSPGIKVSESPTYPPGTLAQSQSQVKDQCQGHGQSQGQSKGCLKPVGSPIDLLPAGLPYPEAFALQRLHDQKKQEEHVYQNVEKLSKVSISDKKEFASDPKKLAKLGSEESNESNSEEGLELKSDPKKIKAIEDFDKGKQTEQFPESDPKKVAMLMGKEAIASVAKTAVEAEYVNVPSKRNESSEDFGHEGQEQDSEDEGPSLEISGDHCGETGQEFGADACDSQIIDNEEAAVDVLTGDSDTEALKQLGIANKLQPKKAGMLALFDNYEKDIGGSSDLDQSYDYDLEDDDSESTLTESTCMGDVGEAELSINDDDLFTTESGKDSVIHEYENTPPKKEATTTTTETISAHRKKVEFYQNLSLCREHSSENSSEHREQTDESKSGPEDDIRTGHVSRAPTEDECFI